MTNEQSYNIPNKFPYYKSTIIPHTDPQHPHTTAPPTIHAFQHSTAFLQKYILKTCQQTADSGAPFKLSASKLNS